MNDVELAVFVHDPRHRLPWLLRLVRWYLSRRADPMWIAIGEGPVHFTVGAWAYSIDFRHEPVTIR